jgi:hypothetical protein
METVGNQLYRFMGRLRQAASSMRLSRYVGGVWISYLPD